MTAVTLLFWAELRHRWRSWVLVAILVALICGTVLAGIAAGRRTVSAYPRFLESYGFDGYAFALHPIPAISQLPDVATSVLMRGPSNGAPSCFGCTRPINATYFGIAQIPPKRLSKFAKLISGRMPNEARPDEVLAAFSMAQDVGVHVGTRPSRASGGQIARSGNGERLRGNARRARGDAPSGGHRSG